MRLDRLRRRRPGQLSGGEQRRLAIARAMVVEPQWLFLDEPLAHLDGPTRLDLFSLLRDVLADFQPGVLLATHNPSEALRVANRVVVLLDGRIVQQGPAEEVYRHPVSLAGARVLGPADDVAGEALDGVLRRDGLVLLANLPPSLRGPTRLIVRPEQLHFLPQPAGQAKIVRCEFAAGRYSLEVQIDHGCLTACSDRPVAPGTSGQLRLNSPVTEAAASV